VPRPWPKAAEQEEVVFIKSLSGRDPEVVGRELSNSMCPPRSADRSIGFVTTCLAALAFAACGPGTSGSTGAGGSGPTGSGGSKSSGGTTGTGGSTSPGGTTGSGGSKSSGGTTGTGGSTGAGGLATGGTTGSGGFIGTAGTTGSAGSTGSGGLATGGSNGGSGLAGTGGSAMGGATGIGGKGGTTGSAGVTGTGGTTGGAGLTGKGGTTGSAGVTGAAGSGPGGTTGTGGAGNDGGPASAATSTIVGNGCTPPAQYENLFITLLGQTQASSDAKLAAAWNQLYNPSNANTVFYNGPGTGEAYVEDIADSAVRSEGQSYGMMTAVQLNHQTEFDELWTFVKNHMWKSGSNTISWQTNTSGAVTGSGGAPDGDEWFAAALVFAHYRWGDTSGKYNYGTEAQATLNLVRTTDFNQSLHLVRYYTGTDSNGTDASYMLPAFYQTWACFDTANAAFWNSALTATRAWLQTAAGTTGNIGDQSSFAGATTNSSGDDKLRIVANFMSDLNFFDADPFETTYASEYATWVTSNNNGSTAMLACNGLLGFGLPASSGTPFVQKLWSVAIPTGQYRYYDGTLYTIALLHVSGAFRLWY
jgi:oligosaccharide reducing-end xylanase